MFSAGKVVWWAMKGLYEEMMLLLRANLVWFLLSALLGLPIFLALLVFLPDVLTSPEAGGLLLPMTLAGFVLLVVPNPASLGLHCLAVRMHRKDSPPWSDFWDGLRANLGLGLKLYAIGTFGLVVLLVNTAFYLLLQQGPLQFLGVVWLYVGLFWIAIQLYLGPLVVLMGERHLPALYRRAALLVVGQPIYSLLYLFWIMILMLIAPLVPPLYPALGMAFVALMTTRGLGELKRKYNPEPEPDEETA
jgi:uncharacterized membrane protein YesL